MGDQHQGGACLRIQLEQQLADALASFKLRDRRFGGL